MVRKIVIIGPESTGKSTLCQQLADYYGTVWCPEYAREYLIENGKDYTYEDLHHIARGQLQLEDNLLSEARNNFYFIDTDMRVMKVWCEVAFNDCPAWILKSIATRPYDLHLLCDVDLPWVADELREYPDPAFRQRLYKMYLDLMVAHPGNWAVVSGSYADRLQAAITIINAHFPHP
ncbi:ATP-binding protein [Paraflavisolibacter sp. H34]|uniref:ATP-binding protein n=1 Tax=Huijunlia imazamoxiresistens TaxID=3127457 RepID=UPI0030162E50